MGIGAATAHLLGELGASVAILDLDAAHGEATVAEIQQRGHQSAFFMRAMWGQRSAQVERCVVHGAEARFGAVHLLVSNAGIQRYGDVVSTSVEQWDETLRVHVQGCFLYGARSRSGYAPRGWGSLGGDGLGADIHGGAELRRVCHCKACLTGHWCARWLWDYATRGIRANCVLPGTIDTPMLRSVAADARDPEFLLQQQCARMHPLGRIGRPEEVARARLHSC